MVFLLLFLLLLLRGPNGGTQIHMWRIVENCVDLVIRYEVGYWNVW